DTRIAGGPAEGLPGAYLHPGEVDVAGFQQLPVLRRKVLADDPHQGDWGENRLREIEIDCGTTKDLTRRFGRRVHGIERDRANDEDRPNVAPAFPRRSGLIHLELQMGNDI